MGKPAQEKAVLSEAWKITKISPPFFVTFAADPGKRYEITKVVLTPNEILLYEKDSDGLSCGHLEVLRVKEKFIHQF